MEDTAGTSTGSTTTGPASFSDASLTWSDASSASTPSADSQSAASASADATDPPATSASTEGQPQHAGAPPQERWNDILANARTKAAEEALAPYAWAKQVDQQEFQRVVELARKSSADPLAYVKEYLKELQNDPVYGPQLRSLHASELARVRQQLQQPQVDAEPQPDLPIQLEDGRVVHLYSAEQQAKRETFLQNKWLQSVQQELQPLRQTHEQLQTERAAVAQQREIQTYATTTLEDVKTWPGMENAANQRAIAEELGRYPIQSDDARDVTLALHNAYRKVVVPQLSQKAEAKLLDNLQQKAAASTSVNPGSAAPSSPRTVKSFHDLPADAWR